MTTIAERTEATQRTVDRFKGKPFELGSEDCAQMVLFHLAELGQNFTLMNITKYSSAIGAKRTLKKMGFDSLPEFMDANYKRLPAPAFAKVGDILSFPSEDDPLGIGALAIYLGNKLILHYHADALDAVTSRILEQPELGWQAP